MNKKKKARGRGIHPHLIDGPLLTKGRVDGILGVCEKKFIRVQLGFLC